MKIYFYGRILKIINNEKIYSKMVEYKNPPVNFMRKGSLEKASDYI